MGRGYDFNTLQTDFSSGKSVAAILMGIMASDGNLEWDAPVTRYWPEFGKNGKDWIKVVDVMQHEGGLPFLSQNLDFSCLTTERIKANCMVEILEKESVMN